VHHDCQRSIGAIGKCELLERELRANSRHWDFARKRTSSDRAKAAFRASAVLRDAKLKHHAPKGSPFGDTAPVISETRSSSFRNRGDDLDLEG
jgi:hypothetical protein